MSNSHQAEPTRGAAERTALVALVSGGTPRRVVEEHLEELERLVDTAGGAVVACEIQERPAPDPATVVGSGFLERLADRCRDERIEVVVFDEDLTASQVRNIERSLTSTVKVLDRAAVILDIFAQRARSREAQTQVELAQLSYLLPRLTRRWRHLSRQAGGIGTRGVGETQLEIDRRLIFRRIAQLKDKLEVIERDRRHRRQGRSELPAIALVGYTNAGKSSLFGRSPAAMCWSKIGCSRRSTPGRAGRRSVTAWWRFSLTPSASSASCPTTSSRRSARPRGGHRGRPRSTWWTSRTGTGRSSSRSATRCSRGSA
jgi:hypothetical protein